MAGFVVHRNIHRFQELLKAEMDSAHRGLLVALLAEEEAKLAGLRRSSARTQPPDGIRDR